MKKIGLYKIEYDNIKNYFLNNKNVLISKITDIKNSKNFDLVVTYNCKNINLKNGINIYPALLPAYKESENPILDAFNDGVKVSGVTIHKGDRIIAQYPVLLSNETHFDEFENEMLNIEKKLVPIVIDCIINDRVFDFQDLLKSPCSKSGCSGCRGCH